MKKIFAIALALVMVLSMASAFAYECVTYDWACATTTTNCGKGSIELIPYVKGNDCVGTTANFVPNTCAGAVVGDNIYYAVKVTVEANPSSEWWGQAKVTFEGKGLQNNTQAIATVGNHMFAEFGAGSVAQMITALDTAATKELKAGEYYIVADAQGWKAVKAADFDANTAGYLFYSVVQNAAKAKVCAKLTSKYDFVATANNSSTNYVEAGGFRIIYRGGADHEVVFDTFKKDKTTWDDSVVVELDDDDKVAVVKVVVDQNHVATYVGRDANGFLKAEGGYDGVSCNPGALAAKVMDYFKLSFGTCVTEKALNANFGWDDKVESCFAWSKDALAIVDAECVVAIPKTGDASVLAWLF